MENPYYITSYCHIKKGSIALNGTSLFENPMHDFPSFIKSAYKHFDTDYSKFFKMDNLCKLAFMAAEVLLKGEKIATEIDPNIALVLSNRASSLDTDRKYQASIQDRENYYPSPAVFVYTLANICMGEISIRHELYSENSFFIFDDFDPSYLHDYSKSLLDDGKAEKVLCGWVNLDEDSYRAFLFMVAKEGTIALETEAIKRLY